MKPDVTILGQDEFPLIEQQFARLPDMIRRGEYTLETSLKHHEKGERYERDCFEARIAPAVGPGSEIKVNFDVERQYVVNGISWGAECYWKRTNAATMAITGADGATYVCANNAVTYDDDNMGAAISKGLRKLFKVKSDPAAKPLLEELLDLVRVKYAQDQQLVAQQASAVNDRIKQKIGGLGP